MIDGTEKDDDQPDDSELEREVLKNFEKETAEYAVKAYSSWAGALSAWQTFTNDFTKKRLKAMAKASKKLEEIGGDENSEDISDSIAKVMTSQMNSFFEDLTAAQVKAAAVAQKEGAKISGDADAAIRRATRKGSISSSLIIKLRICASRFCSTTNTVSCLAINARTSSLNGKARIRRVSTETFFSAINASASGMAKSVEP